MAGTQSNEERNRPMIMVTLSPDAVKRVDEIADRTGRSRSATIEALIMATELPRRRPSDRA
jgi:predicted transcriptional regulator